MDPEQADESGKSPERLKIEAMLKEQGWTEDGPHWRTPPVAGHQTKLMPYPEAARAVDWYKKPAEKPSTLMGVYPAQKPTELDPQQKL